MLQIVINTENPVVYRELSRAISSQTYAVSAELPENVPYAAILIRDIISDRDEEKKRYIAHNNQADINFYQAFTVYLADSDHILENSNKQLDLRPDNKGELPRSCDFILKKPFEFQELLQIIQRCVASCVANIRVFENYYIADHRRKIVYNKYNNQFINLTDKEADLLLYIINKSQNTLHKKNDNYVIKITKEELLQNVWQYNSNINTSTIETHISRLRAKLHNLGVDSLVAKNLETTETIDDKNISWLTWQGDGYVL